MPEEPLQLATAQAQIKYQSKLADSAFIALYGDTEPVYTLATGRYGHIITMPDGMLIGDLCYIEEYLKWTHAEYMHAYGYVDGQKDQTEHLRIHSSGGYYILVLRLGGDGLGPLGLGFDTGSLSFVCEDLARIEIARSAMLAFLETKRDAILAEKRALQSSYKRHEKWLRKQERRTRMMRAGNVIHGTREVSVRIRGGRHPKYRRDTESVKIRIAKVTAKFIVGDDGKRYAISTLADCRITTPRTFAKTQGAA